MVKEDDRYFEEAKFVDSESVFPQLPKAFDIFIRKGQIVWEICCILIIT